MNNSGLLLLLLFLLNPLQTDIFSQNQSVIWGEIPKTDLEMTSFPADTNASALILYDYGESKFNNELNIELTIHLRVKIFTSKGYEQGTKSIVLETEDDAERIDDIEGVTYNLDDKGEIVKTELDEDEIFEEEINDSYTRYKFTMPALKPGCIFEIRYKIESKFMYLMKDWVFQQSEPVRWSEYKMTVPKNIAYAALHTGYEMWKINESTDCTQNFHGAAATYLGKNIVSCYQYRWAVENAPAVRDEPYITTTNDYVNKVQVQLAGYTFVNIPYKKVLEDWPKLIESLLERYSDEIDVSGDIEDLAQKLTKNLSTPEDKMKAIYNWIINSIVSYGNYLYSSQSPDEVIEYKKGSNADVTFLLLSLLKSVDITGYPVIVSTRGNGFINDLYPIVSQFNYVLAKVVINNKIYFLDATDPDRPYDLLPFKILNVKGLVIQEGKPEWVTFQAEKPNSNSSLVIANINQDGLLTANFEDRLTDYSALNNRSDLKGKKDEEIARELFNTDELGFIIDSVLVNNKDSIDLPLSVKGWLNSETYAQKNGDFIYLNPHMIHRLTENPFKSDERKFKIDYGYKYSRTIVINITIPENYEVTEMLVNKDIKMGNTALFTRRSLKEGNRLQIITKFEIRQPEIKPILYKELKNFYKSVITSQEELLVLSPKVNSINTEKGG